MFERRVEQHQEGTFESIDSALNYADNHPIDSLQYRGFLKTIETFDLKGKCLDVGAGTGELAAALAQKHPGIEITALELSPGMVSVGESRIMEMGLQQRISFIQGDGADKAAVQVGAPYDFIYSTYSLHHWEHPQRVVENLLVGLKPGGTIYLYDLRRVWWLYWIPVRNGFTDSIRAAYTRREVKDLLGDFYSLNSRIIHEFPFMMSITITSS